MSDHSQNDRSEVQHTDAEHGTTTSGSVAEAVEFQSVSPENHELHASDLHDTVLNGNSADDHLYGGRHNDVLDGGDGNDTLNGGDGSDVLIAGGQTDAGVNSVDGGSGDDILVGGGAKTHEFDAFLQAHREVADLAHADIRFAGLVSLVDAAPAATDASVATNVFALHAGNGHDAIFNFHAHGDKIQIDRGVNGSDITDINSLVQHLSVSGNDLTIDLGQGNSVTLVGVDLAHLSAENILWA